jgi:hypothetical protein
MDTNSGFKTLVPFLRKLLHLIVAKDALIFMYLLKIVLGKQYRAAEGNERPLSMSKCQLVRLAVC